MTIITLGAFRTSAVATGMVKMPIHPAYSGKPDLPSVRSRKAILASLTDEMDSAYNVRGDPAKAAEALYRLSSHPSPPVRLVLGKDVIGMAQAKVERLKAEAEFSVPWSENVDLDK